MPILPKAGPADLGVSGDHRESGMLRENLFLDTSQAQRFGFRIGSVWRASASDSLKQQRVRSAAERKDRFAQPQAGSYLKKWVVMKNGAAKRVGSCCSCRVIRRCLLSVSLILLIGGIAFLRSYRFERVANESALALPDLKSAIAELPEGVEWVDGPHGPALRLTALPGAHVGLKFRLPFSEPVQALHVRLEMVADHLVRGKKEWEDGRVLVQWLAPDKEERQETDPLSSVFGNESKGGVSLVARPSAGSGFPVLLVQNLGASGEILITGLELSPVRQRVGWSLMRWVIAACWFLWIVAWLSGSPKISFPRRCAAAGAWVALATVFAFPGPWKSLPPMLAPYDLGGSIEVQRGKGGGAAENPEQQTKKPHGVVNHEAFGRIPLQNNWIIQAKSHLKKFRPLLHIGFVFVVAMAFLWLVGMRLASWLAAGLVVAIEASQFGFGFGFDWGDVLDLACGAAGILLAQRLQVRLAPRLARLPRMFAPPAQIAAPSVTGSAPDQGEPLRAIDP